MKSTALQRSACWLASGDFLSTLFDNWDRMPAMSAYVMLSAIPFQRGSAESRDPTIQTGPTRNYGLSIRGGTRCGFYSWSLGIALAVLFVISFALHGWSSLGAAN
ncbi:DUF6766 family protein [Mesorhizobium salmacidum]|uniref:Uncharacterized protein n=1 Tax=Mesorhizobium salmacidum TaxID=3015171 RepID=A0ABU8L7F5_9HYPH